MDNSLTDVSYKMHKKFIKSVNKLLDDGCQHNIVLTESMACLGSFLGSTINSLLPNDKKKQEAYLIKNSKLVVACDNVSNYIASGLDIPSLGLYSAYPAKCTSPIWNEKHFSFESSRDDNLPGYGVNETPKTINFIEPEKIANKIFESLGLPDRASHETIYIGDAYPTKVVEIIPDFTPAPGFMENRA